MSFLNVLGIAFRMLKKAQKLSQLTVICYCESASEFIFYYGQKMQMIDSIWTPHEYGTFWNLWINNILQSSPHCLYRFQNFSGKLHSGEKKYFIFYELKRLTSSSFALLIIVKTLSPKRFRLQILFWERRKDWFTVSDPTVILYFVLYCVRAFPFFRGTTTSISWLSFCHFFGFVRTTSAARFVFIFSSS